MLYNKDPFFPSNGSDALIKEKPLSLQCSSAKFEIHETEDNGNWDLWNDQSPQGTIFTSSLYFKASQVYYRRFFVKKGKEIKAAFCLSESEDDGVALQTT